MILEYFGQLVFAAVEIFYALYVCFDKLLAFGDCFLRVGVSFFACVGNNLVGGGFRSVKKLFCLTSRLGKNLGYFFGAYAVFKLR